MQKNGDVRIIDCTGESASETIFNLFEVYQIVWSDPTESSNNPLLAFTFKDQRKYQTIEIYFQHPNEKDDFLQNAQQFD
jgi:hypothetical protein